MDAVAIPTTSSLLRARNAEREQKTRGKTRGAEVDSAAPGAFMKHNLVVLAKGNPISIL
jgi:hypothetical protein